MGVRKKTNGGFSLLELSIVIAILMIFSSLAFWNLKTIISTNRAKECSRNLLMINQAVSSYSVDNNIPYETTVQMADLTAGGYLNSQENYVCPVNKTAYQTTFTYGTVPVCPDGLSNHVCSTD
jgi:prepilin-type N-terminal cleavage/methylation domain-containing protein